MTAIEQFQSHNLMQQADMLSKSGIVPKAFRGKPADVLAACLWGAEVGLGPMASMSYIDIIDGTPTINAEGCNALVRRAGHSMSLQVTPTQAVATGKRRDTGDEMTVTWTLEMAKRANLASKAVWKSYPEAMLTARAVTQLCRSLFPDVLAGVSYGAEEVASFSSPALLDEPEAFVAPQVAAPTAGVAGGGGTQAVARASTPAPVEVASAAPRSFAPPANAKTTKPAETMREAQAAVAAVNAKHAGKVVGDGVTPDAMKALRADLAALTVQTLRDELRDQFAAAGLPNIKHEGVVLDDDEHAVALDLVLKKLEKQATLEAPFEEPSLLDGEAAS